MAASGLILTYHAVEQGRAPLFVDAGLFTEHLDRLVASGASVLTVSELASLVRARRLPERSVAITFDDGFASVAEVAAPAMAQRGLRGTVFCVADYLGKLNDWPTQPARVPRRRLATAAQLRELAAAGFEIGSHTATHTPLDGDDRDALRRELLGSKWALEDALGVDVCSIAYPYGVSRSAPARQLVRDGYSAACTAAIGTVRQGGDVFELPRVDAHYLRRPGTLERAAGGSIRPYLWLRGKGARARRLVAGDYARAGAG